MTELVMVIVIISALSAMAITHFNGNAFAVAADAVELIEAIRYAQEKSMTNTGAADYQVAINGTGYRVTQAGADITHPVSGGASYQSAWTGVTLAPTGVISFDGSGTPSLSGTLAWSGNQETISINVGSESKTVTIEQLTGFTR